MGWAKPTQSGWCGRHGCGRAVAVHGRAKPLEPLVDVLHVARASVAVEAVHGVGVRTGKGLPGSMVPRAGGVEAQLRVPLCWRA